MPRGIQNMKNQHLINVSNDYFGFFFFFKIASLFSVLSRLLIGVCRTPKRSIRSFYANPKFVTLFMILCESCARAPAITIKITCEVLQWFHNRFTRVCERFTRDSREADVNPRRILRKLIHSDRLSSYNL